MFQLKKIDQNLAIDENKQRQREKLPESFILIYPAEYLWEN